MNEICMRPMTNVVHIYTYIEKQESTANVCACSHEVYTVYTDAHKFCTKLSSFLHVHIHVATTKKLEAGV